MKQRPILFSTEMVQAILAGRKTQTRRVVKPQPKVSEIETVYEVASGEWWVGQLHNFPNVTHFSGHSSTRFKCPYGVPGDVLWVRETLEQSVTGGALYRAGGKVGEPLAENEFVSWDEFSTTRKVIPSIHMPKDAARIWLRIKHVKVERLQDISDSDAKKEGIEIFWKKEINGFEIVESKSITSWTKIPSDTFKSLWKSINGVQSWYDNPWVWVIEFERIEKP